MGYSRMFRTTLTSFAFALFMANAAFGENLFLNQFLETRVTPRQNFELSTSGSLKKIQNAGFDELNETAVEAIAGLKEIPTESTYVKARLPFFSRLYIENDAPIWNLPAVEFSTPLKELMGFLKQNGVSSIATEEVIEAADRNLRKLRHDGKIGGLYFGFKYSKVDREDRFLIELPAAAEDKIDELFDGPIPDVTLSYFESQALVSDSLTPGELLELKRLRKATQIFSENSVFFDQPGGWANNKFEPGKRSKNAPSVIAYCGEHTCTMLEFAKQLENRGKLTSFVAIGNVIKDHISNNHAAVALQNRRTKELFILDSWLVPGGTEAKILTYKSWALWLYNGDEITSLVCPDLLRPTQLKQKGRNSSLVKPITFLEVQA